VTRDRIVTKPGTPIHLKPKMDNIHLFDLESGIRL
jgi:hypothetical protein